GKAAKIARMEIDADSFFRDIMDAVCVIQRDGLSIVFSHRSFQEYFCAYSFLRLSRDEAKPVALRLGQRRRDSVISMLFEMNRSFLEDTYVIPMGERTTQFLSEINAGSKVPNILEYLGCNVIVQCVRRSKKAKSTKLGPA